MLLDATPVPLEDYVLAVGAGAIVAGSIICVAILAKYRSLSGDASRSAQLAKDLWSTLETRLKKQDERIVDLMARVEVYGVRFEKRYSPGGESISLKERPEGVGLDSVEVSGRLEREILGALADRAYSTTEIRQRVGRSREHTARSMKRLFEMGYVVRNERSRPFVYEITETGRRYLAGATAGGT